MHSILTILPRLYPAVDGVGDYGLSLAIELRDRHNLSTSFIVGDPNWQGDNSIEGIGIAKLERQNDLEILKLLESLQSNIVLLHYVGHGYAKRGCPAWLVKGLERWRKHKKDRFLITMFHETYANGEIWKSSFFTSPLQRYLFKSLVRLSDRCITNRRDNAEIICKYSQGRHYQIPVLPVFSNIKEPENLLPLSLRKKRLVVFGGGHYRSMVYKNSVRALESICDALGIEEIIDIGIPLRFAISNINGISVNRMGVRSGLEISNLLLDSVVGFLDYPPDYLCRSGIYAAYCAHKVLPVMGVSYSDRKCEDTLEIGKHLYLADCVADRVADSTPDRRSNNIDLLDAQLIADNAYNWYQSHRLSVHAATFADRIKALPLSAIT